MVAVEREFTLDLTANHIFVTLWGVETQFLVSCLDLDVRVIF